MDQLQATIISDRKYIESWRSNGDGGESPALLVALAQFAADVIETPMRDILHLGMTSDISIEMHRSNFGTSQIGWFQIDWEYAKNWSVDSVAKRTIALVSLALLVCGLIPLLDSVHGQIPQTPQDWEIQHLQEQMKELREVPTQIALIIAQQRIEADWHKEDEDFKGKIVWGFIGTSGSILMALFLWILHQFGISFSPSKVAEEPKRKRPI